MADSRPPSTPADLFAEQLFTEFLDRLEAGEVVEFAAWVEGHPGQRDRLGEIHRRWQALLAAFAALGGGDERSAADPD